MIEVLIILGYVAALSWAAFSAFARPRGVYARCAIGVVAAALLGALAWAVASPSDEAGLGAFILWCALVALALGVAVVASAAATLRYAMNAWRGARA